ncbi:site-specific integrase [Actinomadura rudentiformis]|uniref:Site-specific integrase n=1 Tax=Actinomadura rudentiformis TaxID=359158 RepID=A0A6H9YU56_9ACTN|nr:site-specific integrase [Actinomadura rudentiformis]
MDSLPTATTRASYDDTLARLIDLAGGASPVADLTPEDFAAVMDLWNTAAAATWNRHLSALTSFTTWAQRQAVLETNPARRLQRRRPARLGDRAIPRARLDKLLTDDAHGLRERVLWRMLYETAARAEEILSLDIEDLDPEFRRARVTSKGGAIEYVHWATGSGRLSYPRAEYLFKTATAAPDPHGRGWTLHQLRHSALQHLAAAGRTAAELQAKSRHAHLASLGAYVRLGEHTSAAVTADTDPAARRRTR